MELPFLELKSSANFGLEYQTQKWVIAFLISTNLVN
jgi:hypothetical protein